MEKPCGWVDTEECVCGGMVVVDGGVCMGCMWGRGWMQEPSTVTKTILAVSPVPIENGNKIK